MKIGGKKSVSSGTCVKKSGRGGRPQRPGAGGVENAQTNSDPVALSPRAMEMNRANSMLDDVPDVRGDMVIRLKTEIDSGKYNVKAGKVAEKMIERALLDALNAKKQ